MSDPKPSVDNTPENKPAPGAETKGTKRYPGRPLQVVRVEETGEDKKGRKIVVDEEALKEIMGNIHKTGMKKLYIVSVVGAMRTGKSFLLDLFLRYLTEPVENVAKDPECIFHGPDMQTEPDSQFYWRAHEQRTTTGIWFYSTPFVRTFNGEKVAVVLMDTQGLFDPLSPPEINNAIFGLSVLLSSFQILNVQNRIQEDTLQQLDYFTQFAHSAISMFKATETGEDTTDAEEGEEGAGEEENANLGKHKFQNLQFLVRDWANFDDDTKVEENIKQTKNVLAETLAQNFNDAGQRDRITKSFENVGAYFLPHIGLKPTKKNWDGDLNDVDIGFKKMCSHFLSKIFDKEVVVKKDMVRGTNLDPSSLGYYITSFTEIFKDGKLPKAVSLVTAMTKATTLEAREKAIQKFKRIMDGTAGPEKPYVKQTVLNGTMTKAMEAARKEFKKIAAFGDQKQREEALDNVLDYLEEEGKRYDEANRNRVDKILQDSATLVLVAAVLFVVDFISDYTCDWWLDTCVQVSKLMKYIYTGFAIYIGTKVFFLYNDEGQIVMFKALGGLWAEASRLGIEYYHQYRKELGMDDILNLEAKEEEKKRPTHSRNPSSRRRSSIKADG